ncbi:MAG TPA: hypothetical protein VF132_14285 [Rudaea sp.]
MKTDDIKDTVAEAAENIHEHVDEAEDAIDESVDTIGERLAQMEAKLQEETDRIVESIREVSGAAARYAQARPLAATGIAFAAGILFARLMRR